MQEEALRRMREMQKRSRTAVNSPEQPKSNPPHESQSPPKQPQAQNPRPPQGADIIASLLGDVKPDPEKLMILLMLFVLYKNKADMKLILALAYLLM